MKLISKIFKYVEPLWQGPDGKMSVRATLGIAFSINFMYNLSHAIYKWEMNRPLEGLALVLGIEAGLIAAFFALTTYQNVLAQKNDSLAANPVAPEVRIQNVETMQTGTTTTKANVVKAETVVADKVETINSQNTTVNNKIDNPDA